MGIEGGKRKKGNYIHICRDNVNKRTKEFLFISSSPPPPCHVGILCLTGLRYDLIQSLTKLSPPWAPACPLARPMAARRQARGPIRGRLTTADQWQVVIWCLLGYQMRLKDVIKLMFVLSGRFTCSLAGISFSLSLLSIYPSVYLFIQQYQKKQ